MLGFELVDDFGPTDRNFANIEKYLAHGPAAARVFNSANIAIADDTLTYLTFDSERFDNCGAHSTSSNTGRLTVPTTGLYTIGAMVDFNLDADGYREVVFRANGTTIFARKRIPTVLASVGTVLTLEVPYRLAAGEYVECGVKHTAGASLDVLTFDWSPDFWFVRLGAYA